MEFKNIVATIYLKDGKAVKSPTDFAPDGDIFERAKSYNDCGIDKIFIFDFAVIDRTSIGFEDIFSIHILSPFIENNRLLFFE